MKCISPVSLPSGYRVPCGQCRVCRFARAREWAVRIMHELPYHSSSVFVTLTYGDHSIPYDGSLEVESLQRFFKRLRRRLDGRRIKYYACGEYGDQTGRPHYHAVIFGVSLEEHELGARAKESDSWVALSGPVVSAWSEDQVPIGMVTIGMVVWKSALYVAKYIRKLKTGEQAHVYGTRQHPFSCVSQGLGRTYALSHSDQIRDNMYVSMSGVRMAVNRYYREKLGISSEEVRKASEEARREARKELWKRFGRNPVRSMASLAVELQEEDEGAQRDKNYAAQEELKERRRSV